MKIAYDIDNHTAGGSKWVKDSRPCAVPFSYTADTLLVDSGDLTVRSSPPGFPASRLSKIFYVGAISIYILEKEPPQCNGHIDS